VGRLDKTAISNADLVERTAAAANRGLLAIAANRANEEVWQQLDRLGLPLVQLNQLSANHAADTTYRQQLEHSARLFKLLNLQEKRGRVGRFASADLAMFKLGGTAEPKSPVDWNQLARVIVAGETVWENGKRVGGSPGIFLRRT
jgi:hypothetical protein